MAKFGVPSDRALLKLLKELPDGPASSARGWFDVLSSVEDSTRDNFIKNILGAYKRDEVPSAELISTELSALGLPITRANDLAHGMCTMALLLSARDDSAEDFVLAARQANIIEDRQEAATRAFAENVIDQREIIAETIERITLLMPYCLRSLHWTIQSISGLNWWMGMSSAPFRLLYCV